MAEPEGFAAYGGEDVEANVEYKEDNGGHHHTKFLDLTNGAGTGGGGSGGEIGGHRRAPSDTYGDDDDDDDDSNDEGDEDEDDQIGANNRNRSSNTEDDVEAFMDAQIRAATNRNVQHGGSSSTRLDPHTPGKVVEAGQEHTGRWTKEEHDAFLNALQTYGKEWKKVAAKVKTRTVVQTRTHAQKYFQKLQKSMGSGVNIDDGGHVHVEMGTASEAKKHGSSSSKKRRGNTPSIALKSRTPPNLTSTNTANFFSNLTSAAQAIQTPKANSSETLTASSAFRDIPEVPSLNKSTQQQLSFAPAAASRHGFSTGLDSYRSFNSGGGWGGTSSSMKITAPDPEASAKRGKFPEPSPAACGKRKLAEIAAARMLAGVAAGGKPTMPFSSSAREVEDDDDAEGDVTPPPQSPRSNEKPSPPGLSLRDVPAPPLMSSSKGKSGLSLQIVNPETFGDPYDEQRRRRANGEGSPQTPWDGQLEALVSSKKAGESQKSDDSDETKLPQLPGLSSHIASKHAVCNYGSSYGRSILHKAVCEMDLTTIQSELATENVKEALARRDDAGYCPLHSASALQMLNLNNPALAVEIVRQLVAAGADPYAEDDEGNTPLHWAARAGDQAAAEFLIAKNSTLDAKNNNGETPLHWAMRAGRVGLGVVAVLLDNGARASCLNKSFKRPVDIVADGFDDEAGAAAPRRQIEKPTEKRKRYTKGERRILEAVTEERREARANLLQRSAQSRTLVLHHPECLEHIPKSSSDWEAPDRVTAILGRIANPAANIDGNTALMPYEITLSSEFERAKLDLLSRVHSTDYLAFVNDLSKELERRQKDEATTEDSDAPRSGGTLTPPVVPFTPMVQRSMIKIAESSIKLGSHSDTSFSGGSLRAARRAAGSVQHAVDCVLVGRNRNAMCIVRPPGHHAGINGLLDGGESCGFCIFNNVAAGAMHAISDERLLCERCAIVDIDVHHGNGTEEIVRKCHDPGKLFFFSIHLYDNDKKKQKGNSFQYKFYPGTGAEDDVAYNIINVALTPLWKEPQGKPANNTHNTRQKTRSKVTASDSMDDSSDVGTPRERDSGRFSDAESETASSTNRDRSPPYSPNGQSSAGRLAYRQAIQNRLLPALRAFNPDLILVSAGFDAARADVGNARHERTGERMGLDLEPEDYAWTTRKILEIADICCQGRVVSVLEGGYGRTPTGGGEALDRSNLAECAARHLHAMVDPYDCEGRFS